MKFIHNDLGQRKRGEIVEITLTSGANVRLMDNVNFTSYKNGRKHHYIGGLAKKSPIRLGIPRSGHWHIAIDMQGLRGRTRASVRLLPSPLAEIRDAPLSSVPGLIQKNVPPAVETRGETHDVFISHASEDKEEIVRPLAISLSHHV